MPTSSQRLGKISPVERAASACYRTQSPDNLRFKKKKADSGSLIGFPSDSHSRQENALKMEGDRKENTHPSGFVSAFIFAVLCRPSLLGQHCTLTLAVSWRREDGPFPETVSEKAGRSWDLRVGVLCVWENDCPFLVLNPLPGLV